MLTIETIKQIAARATQTAVEIPCAMSIVIVDSGSLFGDGVIVDSGVIVDNGVIVDDSTIQAQAATVNGDLTTCAPVVIDIGIDCLNY